MRKDLGNKGTVITPLPVLIIGTYDENGVPDAMNVAWGGQCSEKHVAINIGHVRKTRDNITLKREFTVSFATVETVEMSDYFGIESGLHASKIEKAGAHAVRATHVDAPIITEYPLTLECRLHSMEEMDTDEIRIVGEVVNINADESILTDGKIDLDKLHPIMFDSAALCYRSIGNVVARAWDAGKKIKAGSTN